VSQLKFKNGTKVSIKHQPEQGLCVVTNECEKTDMVRVESGEPVGHYVVIDTLNPKGKKNMGYHESSLEVSE